MSYYQKVFIVDFLRKDNTHSCSIYDEMNGSPPIRSPVEHHIIVLFQSEKRDLPFVTIVKKWTLIMGSMFNTMNTFTVSIISMQIYYLNIIPSHSSELYEGIYIYIYIYTIYVYKCIFIWILPTYILLIFYY